MEEDASPGWPATRDFIFQAPADLSGRYLARVAGLTQIKPFAAGRPICVPSASHLRAGSVPSASHQAAAKRLDGSYIHAMSMSLPDTRCGAMILAAGRGERMRPLTDTCPKPLLFVRGKPLMQWPIEALARAGMRDVLVNTAWLGDQIESYFAGPSVAWAPDLTQPGLDSQIGVPVRLEGAPVWLEGASVRLEGASVRLVRAPVRLVYSHEGRDFGGALETAGGIARALPQLADLFWLLAGDVFVPEFVFSEAARRAFMASDALAHIWLVLNPPHNPKGDFGLTQEGLARNDGPGRYTYSTIGLFRHALFAPPFCDIPAGNPAGARAALAPLLRIAAQHERLTAQLYTGPWTDVGTPERLAQLQIPRAS